MKGYIKGPLSKAAMLVHGPDPLIQELPLGPVLLTVQAFCFQDEMLLAGQPDDEVRIIFADDAIKVIDNVKP